MALSKYKLGSLIELLWQTNSDLHYTTDDVRGVNNLKQLMPTKADLNGRDLSKFQIVNPGDFVFNHRTSRNGSKFSIAYNDSENPVICTEDYVVFRIKPECKKTLLAVWLYMYFNRTEFDRYVITNSWGSSTEFYNWEDLCSIDIDLPDLPTQQKYVDIYKSMVANQQSYERGLEDLKLVCDGYFDSAKKSETIRLVEVIEKCEIRNHNLKYSENDVRGITNNKQFSNTKADLVGTDLSKFKIVKNGEFAYNSRTDGRDMLVLGLNRDKPIIVTFNYGVFKIKDDKKGSISPEFLYAFFLRSEFDRRVRFNSWGSSQELLSWTDLCDIQVPFPKFTEQQAIAEIYLAYTARREINEKLKSQIKDICPILIKGSLEEGKND